MAKTSLINTSIPVSGDPPQGGADAIRGLKNSVVEFLAVDHHMDPASPYDEDDAGQHKQVTFNAAIADPAVPVQGILYVKTVDGKSQLHFIDVDSNVIQLTSGGKINGAALKDDSVGAAAIKMEHDAWLTGGGHTSGSINLIRATGAAGSEVAEIPDGAVLATDAAPTVDNGIVNKKYVDDGLTAKAGYVHSGAIVFGSPSGALPPGPSAFVNLDLSAVVGVNRALVLLKVKALDYQNSFSFRTEGDTDNVGEGSGLAHAYAAGVSACYCVINNACCVIVATNASGVIEWNSLYAGTSKAQIWVIGYWK